MAALFVSCLGTHRPERPVTSVIGPQVTGPSGRFAAMSPRITWAPANTGCHLTHAMNVRPAFSLALLGLASIAFTASASESVNECVDLGSDQEIVRAGSGQQIFLRDGQTHYRIGFARTCNSIQVTSSIKIRAEGQENRLCPSGTKVITREANCDVSVVEPISAEEFTKRKKRASR